MRNNQQDFSAVHQNYKRVCHSVNLQLEAKQVRDCSVSSLRCNKLQLEDCLVKLLYNNQLREVFSSRVLQKFKSTFLEQEVDYLEVNLQHQLVVCLDNHLSSSQLLELVFSDKHLSQFSNQQVGVFLGNQRLSSQHRVDYLEVRLSSNLQEDFLAARNYNNLQVVVCLGQSLKRWEDCLINSQLSLLPVFSVPNLRSPLEEDYSDSRLRPVSFLYNLSSSR